MLAAAAASAQASAVQSFVWSVVPPVVMLADPGQQSGLDGGTVSRSLFAIDSASHTLSYSATGLPSGLSINSSTGVISGTLGGSAHASSPYLVTITAADSISSVTATQKFAWVVTATTPDT